MFFGELLDITFCFRQVHLKSFAIAYDFRGRNVGYKKFFVYLISFFSVLSPRGTGREDYIIYMLLYIMVWTMCSLKIFRSEF